MDKKNNRNAKFTDEQLKEIWVTGLSERKIAKKFEVSRSVISRRKQKLGLVANNEPPRGEKKSAKHLMAKYKMYSKQASEWSDKHYTKKEKSIMNKKSYSHPDVKDRMKKYAKEHPEHRLRFGKEYKKEWHKKNPGKQPEYSKRWYERMKQKVTINIGRIRNEMPGV